MSGQSYDSNYAYYATNGKENVNEIAGAPVKSRVKWQGPVLTVDADAERQGRQYRFHDEWWLGAGGKTLLVRRRLEGSSGAVSIRTQVACMTGRSAGRLR